MQQVLKYKTITGQATAEFKDRGSRFIAFAFGVEDAADIKPNINAVKDLHPRATHHCIAWRLGVDGSQYRASDNGEPAGSAGRPMLGAIDSAGLTNVLVVVVRYYGGTMLGVPGLINAYKTVTTDALAAAAVEEKWVRSSLQVSFDYPVMGEVLYVLKGADAIILKQDLQLFCEITAALPISAIEGCKEKLTAIRGVVIKKHV